MPLRELLFIATFSDIHALFVTSLQAQKVVPNSYVAQDQRSLGQIAASTGGQSPEKRPSMLQQQQPAMMSMPQQQQVRLVDYVSLCAVQSV